MIGIALASVLSASPASAYTTVLVTKCRDGVEVHLRDAKGRTHLITFRKSITGDSNCSSDTRKGDTFTDAGSDNLSMTLAQKRTGALCSAPRHTRWTVAAVRPPLTWSEARPYFLRKPDGSMDWNSPSPMKIPTFQEVALTNGKMTATVYVAEHFSMVGRHQPADCALKAGDVLLLNEFQRSKLERGELAFIDRSAPPFDQCGVALSYMTLFPPLEK